MKIVLEFKAPGTVGVVLTLPKFVILSVEQGGSTLRVLEDNVTIALFNDVLLWRRDDLISVELQRI
jgi:hypothetical protein